MMKVSSRPGEVCAARLGELRAERRQGKLIELYDEGNVSICKG